jgi:hypothetical protein
MINRTNFVLYQNIFKSLGNNDFHEFFKGKSPDSPQRFYLSINSLRGIPSTKVEEKRYSPSLLFDFSIPIGLFPLFYLFKIFFEESVFNTFKQILIQSCCDIFNQIKKGIFSYINSEQKEFFLFLHTHKNLLNYFSDLFQLPLQQIKIKIKREQLNTNYQNKDLSVQIENLTKANKLILNEKIHLT